MSSRSSPATRPGLWRFFLPWYWQFTIRELLLLTAGVGAFLAWAGLFYERNKPFNCSAVPDHVGQHDQILAICRELGHKAPSYYSTGGGSDADSCDYWRECLVNVPRAKRAPFMNAYRDEIRRTIAQHADHVNGSGTTSDGGVLNGFEFTYDKGSSRGTVIVRSSLQGAEQLELFIFVHEHANRR